MCNIADAIMLEILFRGWIEATGFISYHDSDWLITREGFIARIKECLV